MSQLRSHDAGMAMSDQPVERDEAKPQSPLRTNLPRASYASEEVFEAEVQRIFLRQWTFVAHASQVAVPGAYVTDEIAGESFILVRDDSGALHALLNMCRHRGHRLCEEVSGSARRFVCPYHQWTYHLDGRLSHVPGPRHSSTRPTGDCIAATSRSGTDSCSCRCPTQHLRRSHLRSMRSPRT